MATSGTVATTTIDTAALIEHSTRRCGLPTSGQTPEFIQAAKESLYILLLSLANRGINLWCVEKQLIGCNTGQAVYPSNAGTIDILNVLYSQPTRATGTDTNTTTSYTTQLTSTTQIVRIGVKFSAVVAADTLVLSHSSDNTTWTTIVSKAKTDWTTGTFYWFDMPIVPTDTYFKISTTGLCTVSDFYLAPTVSDIPVTQWNRDTWAAIPDKSKLGHPSTSYYLEKLLIPQITLWPTPDTNYNHLSLFCHRQVQDMGTLIETIEIPNRWIEGITWQLALRIGFETPGVDPERLSQVIKMAQQYLLEAEGDETDGAPVFLQPNISVYTR